MRHITTLFILLPLLTMVSCRPGFIQEGRQQIDSLRTEIVALQKEMQALDYNHVGRKLDTLEKNLDYVLQEYRDTFSLELAGLLSEYRSIRKPLSKFKEAFPVYLEELKHSERQLEDLRKDLVENHLNDSTFRKYLDDEKAILQEWKQKIGWMSETVSAKLHAFDSLHPRVTEVVMELKNKE